MCIYEPNDATVETLPRLLGGARRRDGQSIRADVIVEIAIPAIIPRWSHLRAVILRFPFQRPLQFLVLVDVLNCLLRLLAKLVELGGVVRLVELPQQARVVVDLSIALVNCLLHFN